MNTRKLSLGRKTRETEIQIELALDGTGRSEIRTGLAFLDHMLTTLARHASLDLVLTCRGDLEVDDHHTVEDCALLLGQAVDQALGDRAGIARFGWALVPMDETLARVALDLSARPWSEVHLGFSRERIGAVATENLTHFFHSFARAARATLHVDILRGENDHHRSEAAFKALALSLKSAVALVQPGVVASTKGVLG